MRCLHCMTMRKICFIIYVFLSAPFIHAEDGYRLWLRYDRIDDPVLLQQYRSQINSINFQGSSPTLTVAKKELLDGLQGLLGKKIIETGSRQNNSIIISKRFPGQSGIAVHYDALGNDGFTIFTLDSKKHVTVITANGDAGILYGIFHFLRMMQTHQAISNLRLTSTPRIQNRILDHWDNLNRTVERGYAGASIWNWHLLPGYIDKRYIDYARANASIGINGTVLTNVNANALVLTKDYLIKVKALADVFRNYNIKVYLTARFSAPIDIGGLKTADPLDPAVQNWWNKKVDEIYSYIPDFGGFLVKANSEGQPGPQTYERTHADGANMLADALAPQHGIVMWRAFVYDVRPQKSSENFDSLKMDPSAPTITSADRFKLAYDEFKPLDGKFRKNVVIQVKNGPIDFQPREPFHPLFGAMPQTPLIMEFQLTQEYLGFATHLVFLAPLFKECLDADTYARRKNSSVAKVIDGSLEDHSISGIAGVANIGNDINWTVELCKCINSRNHCGSTCPGTEHCGSSPTALSV